MVSPLTTADGGDIGEIRAVYSPAQEDQVESNGLVISDH